VDTDPEGIGTGVDDLEMAKWTGIAAWNRFGSPSLMVTDLYLESGASWAQERDGTSNRKRPRNRVGLRAKTMVRIIWRPEADRWSFMVVEID
jgi:hypothetical protein